MKLRKITREWRALAPVAVLLAAAGCSDKDQGPTGVTEPVALDALDATTVGSQSVATMSFVNELVGGVDEMALGDLSNVGADLGIPAGALRAQVVPVWDGVQGAWVVDVQGTETDSTGTSSYDVYFWVQYRDGTGAPQQQPDLLTAEMEMQVDYLVDAHAEDQGAVFDILLDYEMGMTIGGLPSGPYSVDGVGDMSIDMQWADGADQLRIAMGMGWLANLVVPANDGCPSGTATVTVEDWTFNAAYDGVGGYAWELFQGASKVDQGSEVLLCTVPAN